MDVTLGNASSMPLPDASFDFIVNLLAINAWMARLLFRFGRLRAASTREQIESMAMQSRFGRCDITSDGIGFEMRLTKALGRL